MSETTRDDMADATRDGSGFKGRGAYQSMNFDPYSLQQEADAEGWTAITRPAPGAPADAMTIGTRGASDEAVGDKDSPASGYE